MPHDHGDRSHAHLHSHSTSPHEHARSRTPLGAFAVGLLHGIGGSAGVGILLVSTIDRTALAIGALGILAAFTAVSMTLLTTGFGLTLGRRSLGRLAPALGVASLAFGLWYALGSAESPAVLFLGEPDRRPGRITRSPDEQRPTRSPSRLRARRARRRRARALRAAPRGLRRSAPSSLRCFASPSRPWRTRPRGRSRRRSCATGSSKARVPNRGRRSSSCRRRNWALGAVAAVAAAAACLAVGLGIWANSLSNSLDRERSANVGVHRSGELLATNATAKPLIGAERVAARRRRTAGPRSSSADWPTHRARRPTKPG